MAITAQDIVNRIQGNLGVPWKTPTTDAFQAGRPEVAVTGVVTTFAASFEVMRKAVASQKNMIVCRETPFWDRISAPGGGRGRGGPTREALENNPTYRLKQEFIAKNNLTIWRFSENWNARKADGQLIGLARALGWQDGYRQTGAASWAKDSGYFSIPSGSLKATATDIKRKLKMKSMRIIGEPDTKLSKAILSPGYYVVPQLEKHLSDPAVDLLVIGEPVEWEASPYFADVVTSGQKKGLIVLGNEVSEEPGSGEVAAWLKTFVTEVPVEWIPAGEPTWMPY
jgi:putative NIF3 family GTP cyclohydrolase 1 type 2